MTVLVVLCWLIVCFFSRDPGNATLPLFLSASAVMLVATVLVVWYLHKNSTTMPFTWIFLTALLLRLLSVYGEPLFEDDHYRYMWDGFQTATTNDPYTLAPAVFFDRDVPEVFEPILSLINYSEIATVYGPVAQWVFALGYLIDAAQIWPLQLLAGMADLLTLVLLWRLGAGNALLFYAWSPLLLKEFALTAHPDIYAILALVIAIYTAKKHLPVVAGIALGVGFGAKVFTVLALPYLLSARWSVKYWVSILGSFVLTLLAITYWFGTFKIWAPEGLLAMADSWLFNAGLYIVLLNVFDFNTIKIILLACFVCYGLYTFIKRLKRVYASEALTAEMEHPQSAAQLQTSVRHQSVEWSQSAHGFRGDWLFLMFLLALPVINPWYVAWLLPFATLYPRYWTWAVSYFCLLSYWYGANVGISGAGSLLLPTSIIVMEYIAVLLTTTVAWIVTRQLKHYKEYTGA